jgi:Zn-dependent metalloprotease
MAQSKSLPGKKKFFMVGGQDPVVTLVTPTAQTVARAKALLNSHPVKGMQIRRPVNKKKKPKARSAKKASKKPVKKTKPKAISTKKAPKKSKGGSKKVIKRAKQPGGKAKTGKVVKRRKNKKSTVSDTFGKK